MEHRLILGGAQYLPFARSRIKALRAAGKRYASERHVFADGEVDVRIADEQEYIALTGGGSSMAMDSGIIDLKGVEAAAPARFTRATRGETSSTQAYQAGFTPGTGQWGGWLTHPAVPPSKDLPAHQLIGTVTFPGFAGHLRTDGEAPSFAPKRKAVEPATDPASWVDDPADTALAAKKFMANRCPPSIFTGRTRLYVQAMYGRGTYRYNSPQSVSPAASDPQPPALLSEAPPTLTVPAFKRADDAAPLLPVTIGTSTGIRFDAATGHHWLINVDGPNLSVYPLRAPSAIEALRKSLATLDAQEAEKLEAYILAYSLPDVKNSFTVPAGTLTPSISMGYGWHWNWAGTAADIVTSTTFDQGIIDGLFCQGMESTHCRISIAVAVDGTWSATRNIVEGPTRWAVHRGYWCITNPVWGGMLTEKTTPKNSSLFLCDAPFYAFYERDELKVCRVKLTQHEAQAANRSCSITFADPAFGGAIFEQTAGMLDGFLTDTSGVAPFFQATFSCGGVTYANLNVPWSALSQRIEVKKTSFTPGAGVFDNTFYGPHDFTTGYPPPFGNYTTVSIDPCLRQQDGAPTITSTRTAFARSANSSSTATIIVPFFDAEAVFMEGTVFIETVDSGLQVSTHSTTALAGQTSQWALVGSDPVTGAIWAPVAQYVQFFAGGSGAALTTTHPADIVADSVLPQGQKLVCRAGVIDATMADLGSYHDNSIDFATVNYAAWAGAAAISPVAFSPTRINPVGVVGAIPQYPALVGWV